MESAPQLPVPRLIRDLRTNTIIPVHRVDEQREAVIGRFTPERWRSFVKDHGAFLDPSLIHSLNELRLDHGYNPTPTWTFVGRLFNSWLPLDANTIPILALLDWVILGVTFLFVFRTYGGGVGASALILFGVGYPWRYAWVGGGFLRYDWLAAVIIGTCMLKRRRFATAGFLFAYGAAVRLFPALILIGVGAVALRDLVRRTNLRWAARLGAGVIAGVGVFFLAGALAGRGFSAWPEFARNIEKHHRTWSTNSAGLELVVLTTPGTLLSAVPEDWPLPQRWATWQEGMNAAQKERRPLYLGLAILLVAGVVAAASASEPDEGAAIGVAAVFAGLVLSCYYWVVLVVLAFRRSTDGVVGVLAANAAALITALFTDDTQIIFAVFSWAVLAVLAALIVPDVRRGAILSGVRPAEAGLGARPWTCQNGTWLHCGFLTSCRAVGEGTNRADLLAGASQPLMTPNGRRRTTGTAMPERWSASTTSAASL